MNIKLECKGIEDLLQVTSGAKISKAIKFAVNRATKTGKTYISKVIRDKWNIRKADLDSKIKIKPYVSKEASITLFGKPISLMYFNPIEQRGQYIKYATRNRGTTPGLAMRKTKKSAIKSLSVEVWKGRRTVLKRSFFIIGMYGSPLVVRRQGTKLYKRFVISEVYMMKQRYYDVENEIISAFNKNWDNQYKQIVKGRSGYLDD